jgi:hypothetical protein
MRTLVLFATLLLSACTYETAEGLKADPGNTHSVKSARPQRDYADCVQKNLDTIRYGAFGDKHPTTRRDRFTHIEIASVQFAAMGFTLFPTSPYVYMYTVDVTEEGTGSAATGYVHPFFPAAGEVWAAMDKCVAREG